MLVFTYFKKYFNHSRLEVGLDRLKKPGVTGPPVSRPRARNFFRSRVAAVETIPCGSRVESSFSCVSNR